MKISKLLSAVGIFAFCVSFGPVRGQDNSAQAAARAALMKQMDQVQAPEPQTPPAAPTAPAVAPEPVPAAPVVVAPPAAETVQPVKIIPADSNASAQDKARAALLEKMAATSPQPSTTAPSAAPVIPGPVPIVAPGLPISMTKEQRLQALLMRYKADQITPEQYHMQRAAILAEP